MSIIDAVTRPPRTGGSIFAGGRTAAAPIIPAAAAAAPVAEQQAAQPSTGSTLHDQIRQRWGRYGDWKSADQDQVDALARLLQLNGVDDLSQFKLSARDEPGAMQTINNGDNGTSEVMGDPRTVFDATYGGRKLGYLGDINGGGDAQLREAKSDYDRRTGPYDEQGRRTELSGNGDLLGWSGAGGGHTGFHVVKGPDGEPVVVPVWGSSRKGSYDAARDVATMVAIAAGGAYAGAGGTAGNVAQGALQGAAAGAGKDILLNENGSVDSLMRSTQAGLVTGAVGGAAKGIGGDMGWSPATTRAVTAGATTAARGGDLSDIATSAVLGGANGMDITGNGIIDRALVNAGTTLARGGSARDAFRGAAMNGLFRGATTALKED